LSSESQLVFVGNQKSLLFRQRIERLLDLRRPKKYTIVDTGGRSFKGLIDLICSGAWVALKILVTAKPTYMIFHGAYSPVLWPLLLLPRVRAVSIIQGSELNVDFVGVRSYLISLILQRSILIACRNEAQRDDAVRLCCVKSERCAIVNWGLKKDLFELSLPHRSGDPVLISPRATQSEYNIPVIFAAVAKLKKEGHRLRFIYVRFNPTFALEDTSVADEILEAPAQNVLWEKIAQADLCISVPDYDGLSNTILEALALGSTPLYSDLPTYAFLKQDDRLGIGVALGDSFEQNVQRLQESLQRALSHLGELRYSAAFRRAFAEDRFRAGSGVDRIVEALSA
jgi:hypothetical protein